VLFAFKNNTQIRPEPGAKGGIYYFLKHIAVGLVIRGRLQIADYAFPEALSVAALP
jgi:hypothetical protein